MTRTKVMGAMLCAALATAACGSSTATADAGFDAGLVFLGNCPGPAIVCQGTLAGAVNESVLDCSGMDAGHRGFMLDLAVFRGFSFLGHSTSTSFQGFYGSSQFRGDQTGVGLTVDGGGSFATDGGVTQISDFCCVCKTPGAGGDCLYDCSFHGTIDARLTSLDGGSDGGIDLHLTY